MWLLKHVYLPLVGNMKELHARLSLDIIKSSCQEKFSMNDYLKE